MNNWNHDDEKAQLALRELAVLTRPMDRVLNPYHPAPFIKSHADLVGVLPVAVRDWGNYFAGEIHGSESDPTLTAFNMDGPASLIIEARMINFDQAPLEKIGEPALWLDFFRAQIDWPLGVMGAGAEFNDPGLGGEINLAENSEISLAFWTGVD